MADLFETDRLRAFAKSEQIATRGEAANMAVELLRWREVFANVTFDPFKAQIARQVTEERRVDPSPIPLLLRCPSCGERHIDRGRFVAHPHHTHACQHCGEVFRPAIEMTVGVQFLPGFKDSELSERPSHNDQGDA